MTAKPPPVPPEQRSPKGPGGAEPRKSGEASGAEKEPNLAEQGRQGNLKQNTTNQGYQQDR